jgi:hypothetical protein
VEELGPRVSPDGDVVNIRKSDAGLVQTETDRLRREAGPMLHPCEPFFLRGGDHYAITEDGCRGVGVESVQAKYIHGLGIWKPTPAFEAG